MYSFPGVVCEKLCHFDKMGRMQALKMASMRYSKFQTGKGWFKNLEKRDALQKAELHSPQRPGEDAGGDGKGDSGEVCNICGCRLSTFCLLRLCISFTLCCSRNYFNKSWLFFHSVAV